MGIFFFRFADELLQQFAAVVDDFFHTGNIAVDQVFIQMGEAAEAESSAGSTLGNGQCAFALTDITLTE